MRKFIVIAALASATVFGKATNLDCSWDDPAAGMRWANVHFFPFPVPPPSVSPIEARESITGDTSEKKLYARYVSLNVDATPSSFPLGVYTARDAQDVSGSFPAADTLELRVTETLSKQSTPPLVSYTAKGTLKRTVHGVTKEYPVKCHGMLIPTH